MNDVLCIYYSRSGNTRKAMREISETLDAEIVEITDSTPRSGFRGWLRCGLDAVKRDTAPLKSFETCRPLEEYRLVILGTPVWAGRCSSITRSFLIAHGAELPENVSYVITHMGDSAYENVFAQMDTYLAAPHRLGLSLQPKAENYHQKLYDFIRAVSGENNA